MPESEQLERVAAALYDHARETAKAKIDGFGVDVSDLVTTVRRMATESMTARVIVFGSYLEEKTIALMKLHMRNMNAREEEEIFGPNSPLGTFSARINVAYHLGWITKKQRKNLHAFRKIRNLFAHEAYRVSISDPRLISYLSNIEVDIEKEIKKINEAMEPSMGIEPPLPPERAFIFKMIYVAGDTFTSLLAGPVALTHRIHPDSLLYAFDDMPEIFKEIRRAMARALIHALATVRDGQSIRSD